MTGVPKHRLSLPWALSHLLLREDDGNQTGHRNLSHSHGDGELPAWTCLKGNLVESVVKSHWQASNDLISLLYLQLFKETTEARWPLLNFGPNGTLYLNANQGLLGVSFWRGDSGCLSIMVETGVVVTARMLSPSRSILAA